jgi:hypothetical protein
MLGNKKLKKKQSSMDHSSTVLLRKMLSFIFSCYVMSKSVENTESSYIELSAREAEERRQMILAQILSSEARERRKLSLLTSFMLMIV